VHIVVDNSDLKNILFKRFIGGLKNASGGYGVIEMLRFRVWRKWMPRLLLWKKSTKP